MTAVRRFCVAFGARWGIVAGVIGGRGVTVLRSHRAVPPGERPPPAPQPCSQSAMGWIDLWRVTGDDFWLSLGALPPEGEYEGSSSRAGDCGNAPQGMTTYGDKQSGSLLTGRRSVADLVVLTYNR
jgi:hypothetical protein